MSLDRQSHLKISQEIGSESISLHDSRQRITNSGSKYIEADNGRRMQCSTAVFLLDSKCREGVESNKSSQPVSSEADNHFKGRQTVSSETLLVTDFNIEAGR